MPDALEQPISVKVRETPPTSQRRRWRNSRAGAWIRSDEAQGSELWDLLSSTTGKRKAVAKDFASAIGGNPKVIEVWVTDSRKDLVMAVALDGSDIEIEVRTTFLDLIMERLDPGEGELCIFPGGCLPDWVKHGEQLI